jgi:hypothetical protein
MNNQEILEEIGRALALLTYQTAAENLAGLYSKNRLTEDLILPIFRVLFDAPGLRNANTGLNNYPFVDLVDDNGGLAVQVTTERTAAKVTYTLQGFLDSGMQDRYARLLFFLLSPTLPNFQKQTKDNWSTRCKGKLDFDPSRDIIGPLNLLPLIQGLPQEQLELIYQLISKSVVGKDFINVEAQLENFSRRALKYESQTGKYIPDVFIETREAKQMARLFCHPVLFLHRQLEIFPKLGLETWNEFLTKLGLTPLFIPALALLSPQKTLKETTEDATRLRESLLELQDRVNYYAKGRREIPIESIPETARPFYAENAWNLSNGFAYGLGRDIHTFIDNVSLIGKRIFILTGRAGQGKTNFVADLMDTFLLRHGIPSAYVSVRKLALQQSTSLGTALAEMLFDHRIKSFQECAKLLSDAADRNRKPFVLILDGLNEHPQGPLFAKQLEDLLFQLLDFPDLKVLMTCRSEFFDQRFGNLRSSALEPYTIVHESIERELEIEEHSGIIEAYFAFFGLQTNLVSQNVIVRLRQDVLLLRFFCEAYGKRGKNQDYVQPWLGSIYRDEIFDLYLKHKLDAIGDAASFADKPLHPEGVSGVRKVLEYCLRYMLEHWQFNSISVSAIPENLGTALQSLLDEELIIRRDAPQAEGFFSPNDETLNFTFDEFRDFLLAQYLVQNVFQTDADAFSRYLDKSVPSGSPTTEGLKKFLFYLARKKENATFLNYYGTKAWYWDVYDAEIFNIPASLVTSQDQEEVRLRLLRGGRQAQLLAVRLAVNWEMNQLLNLDFFLNAVENSNDELFAQLIIEAFSGKQYLRNGPSVNDVCKFVVESILPNYDFDVHSSKHSLFRFLSFLLPVDVDYNGEGPAYRAMLDVLEINSDYVVDVLLTSLAAKFTVHLTYVWSILAHAEELRHHPAALLAAKAQDMTKYSARARQELQWFLEIDEKWKVKSRDH